MQNIFPADKFEALTMLYLENQDLSDTTPEGLYDLYENTYNRIKKYYSTKESQKPDPDYLYSGIRD